MSAVSLFHQLVSQQPKAAANGTVTVPANRKVGPNDPASLGRIIAIAKFFRRKNLLAETDPTWLATFERLAIFDSETGYWIPPEGFTQGEAEALQQRLYDLPWRSSTPASKVTTRKAAPMPKASTVTDDEIAARVAAAEAAAKAVTQPASPVDLRSMIASAVAEAMESYVDKPESANLVPEGYEVRVGKKGPYLAKAR
jgi:hypothetical protein